MINCVNCNSELKEPFKSAVCNDLCLKGAMEYDSDVHRFGFVKAGKIWKEKNIKKDTGKSITKNIKRK